MKKALSLILAALLAASLCACGNNAAESTSSPEPTATAEATATPTAVPTPTAEPTPEPVADYKIGDSIETDNFKMTFDSFDIVSEYVYSINGSTYRTNANDGCKFLLLKGHFENNSAKTISISALDLSCVVNNTYEFNEMSSGSTLLLNFESSGAFSIDPLFDSDYGLYVQVSDKLVEQFETAVFTIKYQADMSDITYTTDSDGNWISDADEGFSVTVGNATSDAVENSTETASAKPTVQSLDIGDTVTTDDYEMTLVSVGFSYDVLPSDTSGYYRHFPADSGKVYINVVADVKNTMKRDITLSELYSCAGIYDGDYTYSGFTAVDDGDGSFLEFNSDVAAVPLATCKVHSLIECPAEVDESDKPVTVQFKIGSEKYEYKLR